MEYKVNHELRTIADSGMNKRFRERDRERERGWGRVKCSPRDRWTLILSYEMFALREIIVMILCVLSL